MKTNLIRISVFFIQLAFVISFTSCSKINNFDFSKKEFVVENLKKYSNVELLQFLTLESINWHFDKPQPELGIECVVIGELINRKATEDLIQAFKKPIDCCQMQYTVEALSEIDDVRICDIFKIYISKKKTINNFYCLNYLAKKGDFTALKILNENYYKYPVSSAEWAEAVKWFGVYKYKPSIPNLIESLEAASLNVSCAAFVCLTQLFEGAHPNYESIEETKIYFTKMYKKSLTNR